MKQVALVTGGSRGIGYGIVKHLAVLGFDIAINGVRAEHAVRDAIESTRASGVEVIYCQGNISLSADRKKNHTIRKRSFWQVKHTGEQCWHSTKRKTGCAKRN